MRLLILLGCAAPAADTPVAEDSGVSTTTDPGWTAPEAAWSADEVAAALQGAVDADLPDPHLFFDWFQWALDQGDEPGGCPNVPRPFVLSESFAGCVSASGWRYAGLTFYEMLDTGYELTGDATIADPAGQPFRSAGYIRSYRTGSDWQLRFGGWWGYPDAAGWVAAVPDMALEMSGGAAGDVHISGGYGPSGVAIYFDAVVVDDEGHHGALRLRDPSGGWYDLALDPDGCGTVDWYGEARGEACVDLRPAAADLLGRLGDTP